MPGGNPTINETTLDLGGFLARRRIPIELWLLQKNIVTVEAFEAFMKEEPSWTYTSEFVNEVTEILKSIKKEITVVEVKPVVLAVEELKTSSEEGSEENSEPFFVSATKERKKSKQS